MTACSEIYSNLFRFAICFILIVMDKFSDCITKKAVIQIYFILQFAFYYHYSPKYMLIFKSWVCMTRHPLPVNYISHCLPVSSLFCLWLKGGAHRIVTYPDAVTSYRLRTSHLQEQNTSLSTKQEGGISLSKLSRLKYLNLPPQAITLEFGLGGGAGESTATRGLAAFTESQNLVPSTHTRCLTAVYNYSSRGSDALFWPTQALRIYVMK